MASPGAPPRAVAPGFLVPLRLAVELPRPLGVSTAPRNVSRAESLAPGSATLEFGNSGNNGTPDELFFTAGPDDESHRLFGKITAA